jgi:GTPase
MYSSNPLLMVTKHHTTQSPTTNRSYFRKGMVLVGADDTPRPVRKFKASVVILHHQTTISAGASHVKPTRPAVRFRAPTLPPIP